MFGENQFISKKSLIHPDEGQWDDYSPQDFAQVMQQREFNKITFHHKSKQLAFRNILIGHLKEETAQIKTPSCLHLAVYFLDLLMDNHSIILEKLIPISHACMALAIKLEENVSVLCLSDTNSNENRDNKEHLQCENIILKFFNWNLLLPTVPHFLYCYMPQALTDDEINYIINKHKKSRTLILHEFQLNINYYLNKIIDDIHYNYYKSSILAAATIAAARFNMELPSWTLQLQILTGYTPNDFEIVLLTFLGVLSFFCELCN